jgi:hypothetical protein
VPRSWNGRYNNIVTTTAIPIPQPHTDEYEAVCEIYSVHRILRMNALYYGIKLRRLQHSNLGLEISIAVSTSATVGALAVMKSAIPYLAAAAALLGVIKPLLAIPARIERLSKLWADYISLSLETGRIVNRMQSCQCIESDMAKAMEDVRNRYDELQKRDDPYPNTGLLLKQKKAVDREMPHASLWAPCEP